MTQQNAQTPVPQVKASLVELFWAQDVLDYWLELGADPQELKKDINAEIAELAGEIYTYHYNTKELLDARLPNLHKWCQALDQVNMLIDGPAERIVIDELWLKAKWGIFLDLDQGDYSLAHTDKIVPFLNVLVNELGDIDVDELGEFLGNYWTDSEREAILKDFYGNDPKGLVRAAKMYHLNVNRLVLDKFFWDSVNNATKLQALFYEAKENGREEDIVYLQEEINIHLDIVTALQDLEPEYKDQIIADFFTPLQ